MVDIFKDTVEQHMSPFRYRLEKVAHVMLIAAILIWLGAPVLYACYAAGFAYFLGGIALTLRSGAAIRPLDKIRDFSLCMVPAAAELSPWLLATAIIINIILVHVED